MLTRSISLRRIKLISFSILLGIFLPVALLTCLSNTNPGHATGAAAEEASGPWENMGVYGGWMSDVAFDPNTGAVYAVGGGYPGFYYSYDTGEHWQGTNPGFAAAQRVIVASDGSVFANLNTLSKSTDGGLTWISVVDTGQAQYAYTIQDFDVDPNDPEHIVIGTGPAGSEGDGTVYVTWDGGVNWISASLSIPATADVFSVAINPTNGQEVYAICRDEVINTTPSYVYQSLDGGQHFTPVLQAAIGDQFFTVAVNTAQTVFAGSNDELYRSSDGLDWENLNAAVGWISFIEFSPVDPETVYIDGWVSNDNGQSWGPFQAGQFLAISPSDPDLMFTSGSLGVLRSTDGGLTWQDKVNGIENLLIWHALSDPADNQVVYFSSENGVGRTFDGGQSWDFPVAGIDLFRTPLAIYPPVSGIAYALNGSDLAISYDYMETWTYYPITTEITVGVTDMAVDPRDPDRIFISHSGHNRDLGYSVGGLNMTEDGGQSWIDVPEFTGLPVNAVKAGVSPTGTLIYAAVGDGFGYNTGRGGVYRSDDLGHTWEVIGLADQMVNDLAIDPLQAEVLYAGLFTSEPGEVHLLYRTLDGGQTWDQLPLDVLGSIGSLGVDPDNTQILLASTGNLLYKSNNRGDSWSFFYQGNPGEQFLAIHIPFLPPSPVSDLTAIAVKDGIELSWKNPADPDYAGVNIRVMTDTFSSAHSVGISLTTQMGEPSAWEIFTHTNVLTSTSYFYSLFSFDHDGRYSAPALISSTTGISNTLFPLPDSQMAALSPANEKVGQVIYLSTSQGLYRYIGADSSDKHIYLPFVLANP